MDVARAYGNLAWAALRNREYAVVDAALAAGLEYCTEPNLDLWRLYLQGFQSRSQLDQGKWTEAAETASVVLGDARTSSIPRILAGVSLGLVRARRGDPRSADALDAALALAEVSEELQRMEAVAAARAEVAWLRGDRAGVVQATEATLHQASALGARGVVGELAHLAGRVLALEGRQVDHRHRQADALLLGARLDRALAEPGGALLDADAIDVGQASDHRT